MSGLNNLMGRGFISPVVHGVLDYPLAAVLIVLPFVLGFDDGAATWIAFAFGIGAAVLAVGTAWSTGIVASFRRSCTAMRMWRSPSR
jgi:predicted cation transporter